MSEFKYACPVCGQHMVCDSSQSGTVMECPTCFQKIVAPQAPADPGGKLILTGTKFTEKKITVPVADPAPVAAVKKDFSLPLVLALAVALCTAAAVWFWHGKKTALPAPPKNLAATNAAPPAKPQPPVAPPATDTLWQLVLGTNALPETPVAGRIHGQDFLPERVVFANGTLVLRQGTRGPVEFGVLINFAGAAPEALAGKNLNVLADTNKSARVTLHWKSDDAPQKTSYEINYAMRLEFGAIAKNRLPGKIYLCTPDAEKSYLVGSFNAVISRPKPKAPAAPAR